MAATVKTKNEAYHRHSLEVMNPGLALFNVPPTDVSLEKNKIYPIFPTSNTNLRPIEFSIEGRDNYVDLSQSYFEIKGKLTLATGGEILDNTKLIPVSNLGHSMIKQIKLLLNGSLITDASDDYAYKAYIETLLNFHKEAQDSYLKLCGWYHHGGFVQAITDNQMDDATPHEAYSALDRDVQATLKEARQAREIFSNLDGSGVREFKMIVYPFLDAFQSSNLLLPKTKIEMDIDLNDPNFYFIGQTARARLDEGAFRMTFHLKEVKVDSTVALDMRQTLQKGIPAMYPVIKTGIRVLDIPSGEASPNTFDDLFRGKVPRRMVMGLLHNKAYNGDPQYDPFFFQKFGLESVRLTLNGEEYPFPEIELNNDKVNDIYGYQTLLQATGMAHRGPGLALTPRQWGLGNALFAWDLTPGNIASSTASSPNYTGQVALKLRFNAAKDHVIKMIVYGEFQNTLEIDRAGTVTYDGK